MAPHSSTLAWEIPWMEEPGGLQSMGWLFESLKTVFVYSLLSYESSLYVLDANSLSESDVQFFSPFCGFIRFLDGTICRIFCHICICISLSSLFNSGYNAKSPFLSELSEQTVFCPA